MEWDGYFSTAEKSPWRIFFFLFFFNVSTGSFERACILQLLGFNDTSSSFIF